MKYKTTKKEVLNEYESVISVGYCDLQNLLWYVDPYAYTSGMYGWNADVYVVDCNTVIVTGYRPFGNVDVDCDLCIKFDNEAIGKDRKERQRLIKEFVLEAMEA